MHFKGFHKKAFSGPRYIRGLAAVQIPDTFNLATKASPPQNQLACGSCYAWASSSVLRDDLMLLGKDPGALSPQYLMDYSGGGCEGGSLDIMALATAGVPLASTYPYIAQDEAKRPCTAAASAPSWQALGEASGVTPQDIESYMVQYNTTTVVTMAAGAGDFQSYAGGVYNGCVFSDPDHMIRIVGWDNQQATFGVNGYLPNGMGKWLAANQWGTDWGAGGYFWIQMTDSLGRKCNNFADEAAGFFFKKSPGGKRLGRGSKGCSKGKK